MKYALEHFLRGIHQVQATVDGWRWFQLIEETPDALRAVGLCYSLSSSELPIDVVFERCDEHIRYRILEGADDIRWRRHTSSKRWKAVYSYAMDSAPPTWDWGEALTGTLEPCTGGKT